MVKKELWIILIIYDYRENGGHLEIYAANNLYDINNKTNLWL